MQDISTSKLILVSIVFGVLMLAGIMVIAKNNKQDENLQVEYPILVEEFSDFECPACGSFFPVVEEIKQEFGKDIKFVYKHYPLTQIHPNAYNAALAAEAAREQSKFDAYHDLLFANQTKLLPDDLLGYARDLKLDIDKFQQDFESDAIAQRVDADILEGRDRDVSGTPTIFVAGERVVFAAGEDLTAKLRSVINEKLEIAVKPSVEPTQSNKDAVKGKDNDKAQTSEQEKKTNKK